MPTIDSPARAPRAFTLVELLAAISILSILMVVIFSVYNHASRAWLAGENRAETFQNARLVLENMARELGGAMARTNSTAGKALTFLSEANPTLLPCLAPPAGLAATPPNDELFFAAPNMDSAKQPYADLTEYGYFVVFAQQDSATAPMRAGHYYLLRHEVRSNATGFDLVVNPSTWNLTPDEISSTNRVPILDNVLRLEFRFEARDTTQSNGTMIVEQWNSNPACPDLPCTCATPATLTPPVPNPQIRLPRAVHIRLALLDRRTADRLAAILGNSPLAQSDLACVIPNCAGDTVNNIANVAVQNVLRENVHIFYKTVHLRNYRDAD